MGPKRYSFAGKEVEKRTYYRRVAESRDDTSSEDVEMPSNPLSIGPSSSSTSSSSPPSTSFPIVGSEDSPLSVEPSNSPAIHSPAPTLSPLGGPSQDEVDIFAGVGFVDGMIPRHAPTPIDLVQTIEKEVLGFQGDLDAANVPITVQSKILERIFKKTSVNQHAGPSNYDGMGLAQLIHMAGILLYYNYLFYIPSNELYILILGFAIHVLYILCIIHKLNILEFTNVY
jgi:hypothetical protein